MTRIITTTRYRFNKPSQITENHYLRIKHILQSNPEYTLLSNVEDFADQYPNLIPELVKKLVIGLVTLLFGLIVLSLDPQNKLVISGLIGGATAAVGFFILIQLFAGLLIFMQEGFSFSLYLRKKRKYFLAMENAVKKSNDYNEFLNLFYR